LAASKTALLAGILALPSRLSTAATRLPFRGILPPAGWNQLGMVSAKVRAGSGKTVQRKSVMTKMRTG
jgi:hypothetical protein